MIARFTEGAGRSRLGFADAVQREFQFLVAANDFRLVEATPTFVRYESDELFLQVFHGRGSYEIGVEVGNRSRPDARYRLPELVHALAPDHAGPTTFQASTPAAVASSVSQVARILETHCAAVLSGDRFALRHVEAVSKVDAEEATGQAQYSATIASADRAWEAKDRERAAELYAAAEPALDATRRRRLEYVRRKPH
jgi:hypothetical protein